MATKKKTVKPKDVVVEPKPVEESVEVSLDYLLDAPFVKSSYAK